MPTGIIRDGRDITNRSGLARRLRMRDLKGHSARRSHSASEHGQRTYIWLELGVRNDRWPSGEARVMRRRVGRWFPIRVISSWVFVLRLEVLLITSAPQPEDEVYDARDDDECANSADHTCDYSDSDKLRNGK